MRPGDMDQWEIENDRTWRGMIQIGLGIVLMLVLAMAVGVGLGFLIWGI